MPDDDRLYIRVMALDEAMSWPDVARVLSGVSGDAELERHPRGGWSVWLPPGTDKAKLSGMLEAGGLQIVI
jgi:hypothetical protein